MNLKQLTSAKHFPTKTYIAAITVFAAYDSLTTYILTTIHGIEAEFSIFSLVFTTPTSLAIGLFTMTIAVSLILLYLERYLLANFIIASKMLAGLVNLMATISISLGTYAAHIWFLNTLVFVYAAVKYGGIKH